MATKSYVTTADSFIGSIFYPAGMTVTVDLSDFEAPSPEDEKASKTSNLVEASKVSQPVPMVIAPIGPTGPNPTKPQQVPPGAVQFGETYLVPGDGETAASEIVGEAPVDKDANTVGSQGSKAKK